MNDKPAEAKSRARNESREFLLVLVLSVLLLITLL
jgi:Tfp pilus assembly protein PilX